MMEAAASGFCMMDLQQEQFIIISMLNESNNPYFSQEATKMGGEGEHSNSIYNGYHPSNEVPSLTILLLL
jgi:hypothetical protein